MGDVETPLADQIERLVSRLGLPRRLRDADVARALLATIAEESMLDMWIKTNPRPIKSAADIAPLLNAAW